MWIVLKIKQGAKAGAYEVRHTCGYVHASFRLKSAALAEAIHLNGRAI